MNAAVFLREFIGRDKYKCGMYVLALYLSLGFSGGAYVGNVARYMYKLRLQRDQGFQLMKLQRRHRHENLENGGDNTSNVQNNATNRSLSYFMYDFMTMIKYSKNGRVYIPGQEYYRDENLSVHEPEEVGAYSMNLSLNENQEEEFKWTLWDRIKEGIVIPVIIMISHGGLIFVPTIGRIFTVPVFYNLCLGCDLFPIDYIIIAANSALNVIWILMFAYSFRNEPDPLGVFYDAKIGMICFVLIIPACILQIYDPSNYYKEYKFNWDIMFCIISCIMFFPVIYGHLIKSYLERKKSRVKPSLTTLSNEIAPQQKSTSPKRKTRYSSKNLPPPSALDVNLIIQEPRARNALLEHMINELSSENLVFVFKVRAWKEVWAKNSAEKVNRVALNIYNEYISRSGKAQINISNGSYSTIEKSMSSSLDSSKQKAGNVSPTDVDKIPITVFDKCEEECIQIIRTDSLPRFRLSTLFKERIIETGILDKVLVISTGN